MRLARYNWPLYLAIMVLVAFGAGLALSSVSFWLRIFGVVGGAIALWFGVASFTAFHLMFDRSPLTRWVWLREEFEVPPARCIQINAGLEETNFNVQEVFPHSQGHVLDVFDPTSMTEPALNRARSLPQSIANTISANVDSLPIESQSADAIFVVLAAHEIRSREKREQLFAELRRVLAPGGKLILVEHLRNWSAFFAFGPGAMHFLPRGEWLQLGSLHDLVVTKERWFTPFVCAMIFEGR